MKLINIPYVFFYTLIILQKIRFRFYLLLIVYLLLFAINSLFLTLGIIA